jgi:hypothetical protein
VDLQIFVSKTLVMYRGTEFCNQILNQLAVLLRMEWAKMAAMHPQSNSAAESWNISLCKFLHQALNSGSTLNWEDHLPALMFSHNTQVHKFTLQTPLYLTFLHPPNMQFFYIDVPTSKYSNSWPTEAFLQMQTAYKLAKKLVKRPTNA